MTTASLPVLQITTIYSARSFTRRMGWSAPVIGLISMVLALVGLYVLWSRIDPFLSFQFMRSAPIASGIDISVFFAPPPKDIANPSPPSGTRPATPVDQAPRVSDEQRLANFAAAKTYGNKLAGLLYSWETLATTSGLILAAAGAAGFVGSDFARHRRDVLMLLIGCGVLATIVFGIWVWTHYRLGWEAKHLHMLTALLAFVAMCWGALGSRGGRSLHTIAAVALIVLSLATVIGLWWANRLKTMPEDFVTPARYLQVGLLPALYGMFLLAWAKRVPPVTA